MEPDPVPAQAFVTGCLVCRGTRLEHRFLVEGDGILRCEERGLLPSNP